MNDVQTEHFQSKGWSVHSWQSMTGSNATVLQREPFRLSWFATQLVTFVYIINRVPADYQDILDDYDALRTFAGKNKRTFLPFAIQCGYALLPIYIGTTFTDKLVADVRMTYKKRWCVIHVPSLLESETGKLHSLEVESYWGCVYRDFIRVTLADVASVLTSYNNAA